jgi:hypothetical protein
VSDDPKAMKRCILELRQMIQEAEYLDFDEIAVQSLETAIESMQMRMEATHPQPVTPAGGEVARGTIDRIVSAFLTWKLPADFSPDNGIRFDEQPSPVGWPTGTNLLNADQAKGLVQHLFSAALSGRDRYSTEEEGDAFTDGYLCGERESMSDHSAAVEYARHNEKVEKEMSDARALYLHPPVADAALVRDAERFRALAKVVTHIKVSYAEPNDCMDDYLARMADAALNQRGGV